MQANDKNSITRGLFVLSWLLVFAVGQVFATDTAQGEKRGYPGEPRLIQSTNCCIGHDDPSGCYVPSLHAAERQDLSDCVCEADPDCCAANWDSTCVSRAESLGCAIDLAQCPPPEEAIDPFPVNNAVAVKPASILSWNCDLIDGFEDRSLSEYTEVAGSGVYKVATTASHDGFYGLEGSEAGGWIYRDDPPSLVAQGETISFWVRPKSLDPDLGGGRAYLGFGASAAGTYSVVVAVNTSQFLLQRNVNYDFQDIPGSSVFQSWKNQWYRVEVQWGTGGQITARLFDQDGVTLLNAVSAVDNTYNAGGIAFRAFFGPKFFDTVQACQSPVAEVAAISEDFKSRFSDDRETEAPEPAAGATDRLVWDEANQAYVAFEELPSIPEAVAGKSVVPQDYSIQSSVPDDLSRAQACPLTYDVFFSTARPPGSKICSDIQTTFCDPGNLAESTRYFWRVVAKNPGGSIPGPVWNFTTGKFCECDLNQDGSCNILDYQIFIQDWGKSNCNDPGVVCECDLNLDGACNILDYQLFIQDWGQTGCSVPPDAVVP